MLGLSHFSSCFFLYKLIKNKTWRTRLSTEKNVSLCFYNIFGSSYLEIIIRELSKMYIKHNFQQESNSLFKKFLENSSKKTRHLQKRQAK